MWSPAQPCPPPPSASSSLGGMIPAPLISSLWFPSLDLEVKSVSRSVRSDSFRPCGLQPARLLCPWDSPGRNTGVGCHSLLQGIFLTCLNRILDKQSMKAAVPNLQGLMPDDLRWSRGPNNRNNVHSKCDALESSQNHPPCRVHGKWSPVSESSGPAAVEGLLLLPLQGPTAQLARAFPGHGTFRAETRKVPGRPGHAGRLGSLKWRTVPAPNLKETVKTTALILCLGSHLRSLCRARLLALRFIALNVPLVLEALWVKSVFRC